MTTLGNGAGCACGTYLSGKAWRGCVFVGVQVGPDDDGDEAVLELRNCPCGSTISGPVTVCDEVVAAARFERRDDWESVYTVLDMVATRAAQRRGTEE